MELLYLRPVGQLTAVVAVVRHHYYKLALFSCVKLYRACGIEVQLGACPCLRDLLGMSRNWLFKREQRLEVGFRLQETLDEDTHMPPCMIPFSGDDVVLLGSTLPCRWCAGHLQSLTVTVCAGTRLQLGTRCLGTRP